MLRPEGGAVQIITEKDVLREMEKKEKCLVYGEEVTIVDGVCQEDCSIQECNLNRDTQPEKKPDRQNKDDESREAPRLIWS